jgi:hypothetical protein
MINFNNLGRNMMVIFPDMIELSFILINNIMNLDRLLV